LRFELGDSTILTTIAIALFLVMLFITTSGYSYHVATATNTNSVKSSFNNCNNKMCQTVTCTNNNCYTTVSNSTQQVLNSTNP